MVNVSITKGGVTFTFPDGTINDITTNIDCGIEETKMPGAGPMQNYAIDYEGTSKTITISGILIDTPSSVLSSGDLRDKKLMKYWLESLADGNQFAMDFKSNLEEYSVSHTGSTMMPDNESGQQVTIPATFTSTKVYVRSIQFRDVVVGNYIEFTISFFVAGV